MTCERAGSKKKIIQGIISDITKMMCECLKNQETIAINP